MDDLNITRNGVFLAAAVRRHADAGRVEEEHLRVLPGRLFAALWLAGVLLLACLVPLVLAVAR
ncbi:hypothetical protein [Dactylosporangium sp. NPDC051484]|uniref:hypothetical protein n=1 Tax=Dactylosporangium sp. NPDC051484 TaxID=3154942 RepID=UPI00344F790A